VPVFIVALVAAHLFDLLSFVVMTDRLGMGAEANPLVVMLEASVGLPGLTLAKLASLALGGTVFVLLARDRRHRLAMAVVLFGVGAGLVGGLSNVATLYAY
jgi:hypothetical protein